jgi:hypothetical protein
MKPVHVKWFKIFWFLLGYTFWTLNLSTAFTPRELAPSSSLIQPDTPYSWLEQKVLYPSFLWAHYLNHCSLPPLWRHTRHTQAVCYMQHVPRLMDYKIIWSIFLTPHFDFVSAHNIVQYNNIYICVFITYFYNLRIVQSHFFLVLPVIPLPTAWTFYQSQWIHV